MSEQNASNTHGVVSPASASVVSVAAQSVANPSPTRAILRRSNMSAIAPAGTDTSINGSISAVCTSATMPGDEVRRVISHAAPTPKMSWPKFEITLADQILRYTRSRSGSRGAQIRLASTRLAVTRQPLAGGARRVVELRVSGAWQ